MKAFFTKNPKIKSRTTEGILVFGAVISKIYDSNTRPHNVIIILNSISIVF